MTAQPVHNLFIRTVNYSIWLVLACDVLAWHGDVQFAYVWWATLRDILTTQFHFTPRHFISSLLSLKPVNSGNSQSLIRLEQWFSPKCPLKTGYFWSFFFFPTQLFSHQGLVLFWRTFEALSDSMCYGSNSQAKTSASNSTLQILPTLGILTACRCRK